VHSAKSPFQHRVILNRVTLSEAKRACPNAWPLRFAQGDSVGGLALCSTHSTLHRADRGIALLEAMVALAILASAGGFLVALVAAGLRSEHELRQRELTLQAAERVLAATTLLTRADLDQRLGRHRVGELLVEVERPEPALYRIAVSENAAPALELLATVVYRADP